MSKYVWFVGLLALVVGWSFMVGEAEETQREFVGVGNCKMCHKHQYKVWSEKVHAKAFEVLANEESQKIAKEKGLGNPQEAPECLKCHVTGFMELEGLTLALKDGEATIGGDNAAHLGKKHDAKDGVGCESCHGAGGDYWKKKTMEGIASGEIDGASVGLLEPNEALCVGCHNEESPTYKEFKFDEMVKMIAHPNPEE